MTQKRSFNSIQSYHLTSEFVAKVSELQKAFKRHLVQDSVSELLVLYFPQTNYTEEEYKDYYKSLESKFTHAQKNGILDKGHYYFLAPYARLLVVLRAPFLHLFPQVPSPKNIDDLNYPELAEHINHALQNKHTEKRLLKYIELADNAKKVIIKPREAIQSKGQRRDFAQQIYLRLSKAFIDKLYAAHSLPPNEQFNDEQLKNIAIHYSHTKSKDVGRAYQCLQKRAKDYVRSWSGSANDYAIIAKLEIGKISTAGSIDDVQDISQILVDSCTQLVRGYKGKTTLLTLIESLLLGISLKSEGPVKKESSIADSGNNNNNQNHVQNSETNLSIASKEIKKRKAVAELKSKPKVKIKKEIKENNNHHNMEISNNNVIVNVFHNAKSVRKADDIFMDSLNPPPLEESNTVPIIQIISNGINPQSIKGFKAPASPIKPRELETMAEQQAFVKQAGLRRYKEGKKDQPQLVYWNNVQILSEVTDKDLGIYAKTEIKKGQIIGEYTGEAVNKANGQNNCSMMLPNKKEISALLNGNFISRINTHSNRGNCDYYANASNNTIEVWANQDIRPHEQLLAFYGEEYRHFDDFIFLNFSDDNLTTEQILENYNEWYSDGFISNETLASIEQSSADDCYIITKLMHAILNNDEQEFEEELNKINSNPNSYKILNLPLLKNKHNNKVDLVARSRQENTTALMLACRLGREKMILDLLKNPNVEVNQQQSLSGLTPLHFLAKLSEVNYEVIFENVIRRNVDLEAADKFDNTFLHTAILEKNISLLDIIFDYTKASFRNTIQKILKSFVNSDNLECMGLAISTGDVETIRFIAKVYKKLYGCKTTAQTFLKINEYYLDLHVEGVRHNEFKLIFNAIPANKLAETLILLCKLGFFAEDTIRQKVIEILQHRQDCPRLKKPNSFQLEMPKLSSLFFSAGDSSKEIQLFESIAKQVNASREIVEPVRGHPNFELMY